MKFEKKMIYLGISSGDFIGDDGVRKVYYKVSFFDSETSTPLSLNIMENPNKVRLIDELVASTFGTPMTVTFVLRSSDKLYRLQLDAVCS